MDTLNIDKFIENVDFFKVFSEHEKRKLIGNKSTFKQYEKGQNIFLEGDSGSSLFVILFGSVSLTKLYDADSNEERVSLKKEKEQVVGELEAGSVFGEISMLTGRKRSVSADVISSKAVVMEISDKYIDKLIPSIQTKFHKQLLLALVKDLDDMDLRYMRLQARNETGINSS